MSEYQNVIDLAQKAERDAALRQALERCQSLDDVAQVAADAGVTISTDELRAFGEHVRKLQQRAADGELSEVELETVAGGLLMSTLIIGGLSVGAAGAITGLIGAAAGTLHFIHGSE